MNSISREGWEEPGKKESHRRKALQSDTGIFFFFAHRALLVYASTQNSFIPTAKYVHGLFKKKKNVHVVKASI